MEKEVAESRNYKPYQSWVSDKTKKSVERKLFSPEQVKSKGNEKEGAPSKENELVTDNFELGSKDDFDILCNVVSVL